MSKRDKERQAARAAAAAAVAAEQRRAKLIRISAIAAAVLLLAGVIGAGVWFAQKDSNSGPTEGPTPASASADGLGITNGNGPVKVDIYFDYLCPICKKFEQSVEATLSDYVQRGRVQAIYHPVDFLDRFSTTEYSARAAAASGCASDGGKFREYSAALFAQQPPERSSGLSNDKLVEIGASVGLTTPEFSTCVKTQKYRPWVRRVTNGATDDRVGGTPTVMVNGKEVDAAVPALTAAIDAA